MKVHIDEEPPEGGSMMTVATKETDWQTQIWAEDRGVTEIWIYDIDEVRVVSHFVDIAPRAEITIEELLGL